MRTWFLHTRESFWFLPALFGVGAIALALGLVELDRFLLREGIDDIPLVEDLSATGGRAMLSAIGGTMLGVAATSFSITISVLATTSSAYGPRLVRNFMADRGNQFVLAVLTSTFLYALVVLRSVRTETDAEVAFVPLVAVTAAVLLAVADVAVLVYFIHHIATSVQVTTLQSRVLGELEAVIDLLHPRERPTSEETDAAPAADDSMEEGAPYRSPRTGYVEQLAIDRLVAAARADGAVLHALVSPGDHVLRGDPLLSVRRVRASSGGHDDDVLAAIVVSDARTPHQDLRYAVQQVIEIGVRGLASGTNDPYTAVGAIDALGSALVTLAQRAGPVTRHRDDDGVVRLVVDWPEGRELTADTCLALRAYGIDHPLVVRAAVRLFERLEHVVDGEDRAALEREVSAFRDSYGTAARDPLDAPAVEAALAAVQARLAVPRASGSAHLSGAR